MRLDRSLLLVVALVAPLAACDLTAPGVDPNAPSNLSYQLIPSGDPNAPLGIILSWQPPMSGRAVAYDVYGRASTGSDWNLRATTTSPSFHDVFPELQYYVVANDEHPLKVDPASRGCAGRSAAVVAFSPAAGRGRSNFLSRRWKPPGRPPNLRSPPLPNLGFETGRCSTGTIVTVDLQSELPAPLGLHSISLNGAVQLAWSSNAVDANRNVFGYYRVYSASFDDAHSTCVSWSLEGSTVSDAFLSANLSNGVTRCFAISAVSRDGHESAWSVATHDTPRYDARNVLVFSHDIRTDSSGFSFYDETARVYGKVTAATSSVADFTIERHVDGTLWFKPSRADVLMATYGTTPVSDLTSIDRAQVVEYHRRGRPRVWIRVQHAQE